MKKCKILIVDDIPTNVTLISTIIKKKLDAYSDTALSGEEALKKIESFNPDIIILDLMMPKMNGIDVLKKLRENGVSTPVLILTAKAQTEDKILGLDSGADDYLTKPFSTGELLARIRAMTRRKSEFSPNLLTFGNLSLNRETYELSTENGKVRLGNKEFQMIEMLMSNAGRLISTEQFMERIWGYETEAEINVVWVHISNLRKKLRAIGSTVTIRTNRGLGYVLESSHD